VGEHNIVPLDTEPGMGFSYTGRVAGAAGAPFSNRSDGPSFMTADARRLVLVVEDDLSVRRPLVKFLEMHGFAVVTAETSDEGLEALKQEGLVAAVVDLRLRRGSGRDVVIATPADIPVIIFSGVPSESAELERIRPRTRLIEKPYSLVLLVETLEEMLAQSQNLHP
jgi:DNA-binding response OmpR family regulator